MLTKLPQKLLTFYLIAICCFSTLFAKGIDRTDDYNKHSKLQWDWAMNALQNYPFKGNERILDIGSGDGKITAFLAKRVPEGLVIGLDISNKMIQFSSKAFPVAENKNLLFIKGTATELPFYRQFDLIFSNCCLHWIKDQHKALTAIRKSLAPGGKALLIVPGAAPSNIEIRCEELANIKKWKPFFMSFKREKVYYSWDEYRSLIDDVGFNIIRHQVVNTVRNYPNKKAFADWLRPLLNITNHLSAELQEEFLQDFTNYMLQLMPPNDNGSINIPFTKMELLLSNNQTK